MAFDVLTTITKQTGRTQASISYRRFTGKKGGSGRPKLIIAIPVALMGPKPKKGTRYVLMLGSGDDAGKAQIRATTKEGEGVEPACFVGGLVFRFGYVPMLGDDSAEKESVNCRQLPVTVGWEIDLPPWFKSDEPAAKIASLKGHAPQHLSGLKKSSA